MPKDSLVKQNIKYRQDIIALEKKKKTKKEENFKRQKKEKISLIKLINGGIPIFKKKKKKNEKIKNFLKDSKDFMKSKERLWENSYNIDTKKKRIKDTNPCPTIIKILESKPTKFPLKRKGKIKPIWTTDEQATKYFKSKNRIIKRLKIKIPKIITLKKNSENNEKKQFIEKENLNKPNLPNFNIKPAKIIEHTPEALTWALVNQKCK